MQRQVPGQDAAPVAVVIEDDPDVRGILAAVLAADGFDVVECADGFAGVAAVEAHHPVLTTCDIHMPGMDGYAVLKRIRSFDDSYVIMISSLSAEIDVVAALAPSGSADAEVLAARKQKAAAQLAESVAALEGIRLDLLRLHAGASAMRPRARIVDAILFMVSVSFYWVVMMRRLRSMHGFLRREPGPAPRRWPAVPAVPRR